eukprot:844660-Pyramimonas_sp.AAC.1
MKGLGCSAHYTDVPLDSDTDGDDEEETFITSPAGLPAESYAEAFSIIPTLCYGRHNKIDMLELRGGSGGTSQPALIQGWSSGGNLDKRSHVALGIKDVQHAVMRCLDVCFANVVMLQPNCRTTGLPSYFNSQVNF